MQLAAAQTTQYDWPPSTHLKPPLIITLGLAALVLLLWAVGASRPHPHRRPMRWLAVPALAPAVSVGWLVASVVSKLVVDRPAPMLVSLAPAPSRPCCARSWRADYRVARPPLGPLKHLRRRVPA